MRYINKHHRNLPKPTNRAEIHKRGRGFEIEAIDKLNSIQNTTFDSIRLHRQLVIKHVNYQKLWDGFDTIMLSNGVILAAR